jgi:signal transduction histidine kinase
LQEQLDSIVTEATHAIDETKEIAYNLRPYQLDRLGLTRSLAEMIHKIAAAHKNQIRFQTRLDVIDGLFPKEAELNLYRIIQESLYNITKHAKATEAEVSIQKDLSGIMIIVQDNGQGFCLKSSASTEAVKSGFGLVSIAERSRLLGGKFTVQSIPGKGTTITVKLALGEEHNEP